MTKIAEKEDYLIAIGASAGGLEEIYRFFENTPVDGVSYVVVQHLSADFKSQMAELLDKHSILQVQEAEEGMLVKINVIYLIPSDQSMTINNSVLHLKNKKEMQRPHNTINIFFESMAKDKANKCVGIILSGAGTDGSEGVKHIKQAGGLVIVSDPAYTEYGSMPVSAIETEMVDYIIPPEQMPEVIMRHVKKEPGKPPAQFDPKDEQLATEIVEFLGNSLPLDFSEYKLTTILRRIKRRSSNLNFSRLEDYFTFLKATPDEAERLSKDFLISVTSFFRDPAAFEYIEKEIIPAILKNHVEGEELKVWVPGCASGEEAYSLAMLIKEQLGNHDKIVVKIFATDIDAAALAIAASGIYNQESLKNVSAQRAEKHFIHEGDSYRIKPGIRKMLIFSHHDLVKNPPFCNMNLISCRNVLIYLSAPLQRRIFSMLHFGLKKDAYLFLGSSENALQMPEGMLLLNKDYKVFQNTTMKKTFQFDSLSLPTPFDIVSLPGKAADKNIQHIRQNLSGTVNEAVMAELGYMVVCTDAKNDVLQVFGDSSKYLVQKNFVSNITELLPDPLALAFKNASFEALRAHHKVLVKGIQLEGGAREVTLLIKPLSIKGDHTPLLMSIFSDERIQPYQQTEALLFEPGAFYDQYTNNVEEELADTKEKLFISYEKLDSYKENIQSFNEELIAANEELQSANEEMQSVNEELYTINTAYLLKNKELSELNDDLNNYFRSNVNGQLFINNDMQLMKFSPNTVKHINLQETDIGRPIKDITTNIKIDTLFEDIQQVISSGEVLSRESEATNGKWYQLMIMPYIRQADDIKDGAIVSFSDITELKAVQGALKKLADQREEFIGIASHELKTPLTSLLGYAEILRDLSEKDRLPQYQEIILRLYKQGIRISGLVNQLLDAVKTEHDHLQLNKTVVVVKDIIDESVSSIKNSYPRQVIHVTGKADFLIHADKPRMEQVINNLLSNAIKFSGEKDIKLNVKQAHNDAVISVSDSGIGIEPEKIPLLFDRFYRISRLGEKQSGLGLGLYICQQIVQLHKGKIEVESTPGAGSTFKVLLPL